MAAEKVIRSVLLDDATVFALVKTRIRPRQAKAKETLPYVVFRMEAGDPWQAADGYTGVGVFTYEFLMYADTPLGATELQDAVRIALDHLPETTVGGQTVLVITVIGRSEAEEFQDEDSQKPVFETSLDMNIFVREAVS